MQTQQRLAHRKAGGKKKGKANRIQPRVRRVEAEEPIKRQNMNGKAQGQVKGNGEEHWADVVADVHAHTITAGEKQTPCGQLHCIIRNGAVEPAHMQRNGT